MVQIFQGKDIDDLTEFVATYRAKGLAWVKVTSDGQPESKYSSGIVKFFKTEHLETAQERMGAKPGDIMFFVADRPKVVADALGNLRLHLGRKLNMIDENRYNFLWIVDYPLFEWNEEEKRYQPFHHLFTGATEDTLPLLDTGPWQGSESTLRFWCVTDTKFVAAVSEYIDGIPNRRFSIS